MWTYKPIDFRDSSSSSSYNSLHLEISRSNSVASYNKLRSASSTLLSSFSTQLLISQAILDSNDFSILPFQKLENLKHELVSNQEHISHIKRNLELENRIHKIAKSLDRFNYTNTGRTSAALQQFQHRLKSRETEDSSKVEYLTGRLEELNQRQIDIQVLILKHTAAVLNKGLHLSTNQIPNSPTTVYHTNHQQRELTLDMILTKIDHLCRSYRITIVPTASTAQKLHQLSQYLMTPSQLPSDNHKKQSDIAILNKEKNQLISRLIKLEHMADRLLSRISHYPERERALQVELLQYKSEATEIQLMRVHQEKRREVEALTIALNQRKQQQSNRKLACFHQQFKSQADDYQQHINEQAFLIRTKTEQSKQLKEKCYQLTIQSNRLDRLVRDKARELDERDNKITSLSDELRYFKQQQQPQQQPFANTSPTAASKLLSTKEAYHQFQQKEQHWQIHTDMLQHRSDDLLNQFDILTNQAMEFDATRMKYDKHIDHLRRHIRDLEIQLIDEQVDTLGHQEKGYQPVNNTVALRKEFRSLVAYLKESHQKKMQKEANEIDKLRKQLYDLRNEQHSSVSNSAMEKKQCSTSTQT
ncbi:Up-regulated during septation-domain-containing protein [Mycotypha africana]|uniref:Up-regulated during septation-domain-containing protein n=1 Tax=Mycotypha africana TaxID=64632 RepID=UPI002300BB7D|nr:Up-regulated during septation-domain-containing protein [Mycotypha africana]KAI8967483.1 Up-regulated during septation-domain-containing protein [Mycotypha africana]